MSKDYKKLYEDALEIAKVWKDKSGMPKDKQGILNDIFPELAESEDERIRNNLIDYFSNCKALKFSEQKIVAWLEKQKTTEEALQYLKENHSPSEVSDFQAAMNIAVAKAYNKGYTDELERQGEQKPVDKIESKFKVGDWVVNEYGFVMRIVDVQDSHYVYIYEGRELSATIEQMENSCHLWNIEDAKDGDVLANDYSIIIFRKIGNEIWNDVIDYYVGCSYEKRKINIQSGKSHYGIANKTTFKPATKKQRMLLFWKIKDASYEWDLEKKELRKI